LQIVYTSIDATHHGGESLVKIFPRFVRIVGVNERIDFPGSRVDHIVDFANPLQPAFGSDAVTGLSTWNESKEILQKPKHQQTPQMDAFAKNNLNDTPVIASGEEGLIDMQIIAAIKKSIAEGRKVEVDYS